MLSFLYGLFISYTLNLENSSVVLIERLRFAHCTPQQRKWQKNTMRLQWQISHSRAIGKGILQVPDTGTQVLDNTKPFWCSSIVCFWMPPACSKERKYHIFGQYWYTRNVPVFTNTGTCQYLGPEVYFFRAIFNGFHVAVANNANSLCIPQCFTQ